MVQLFQRLSLATQNLLPHRMMKFIFNGVCAFVCVFLPKTCRKIEFEVLFNYTYGLTTIGFVRNCEISRREQTACVHFGWTHICSQSGCVFLFYYVFAFMRFRIFFSPLNAPFRLENLISCFMKLTVLESVLHWIWIVHNIVSFGFCAFTKSVNSIRSLYFPAQTLTTSMNKHDCDS